MTYRFAQRDGQTGAPLVLTFHGTGGDEHQFHELAADMLPAAHIVSPRGDVSEGGALRYFRRTGEGVYDMADLASRSEAMANFIAAQCARLRPSEVIGIGYSNGANILAAVMMHRPELVDRAVLLHPLIPWQPAPQPGLSGRRVLMTAGENDPICPAPLTHAFAGYLSAQGVAVQSHWHPGGHQIDRTELAAMQDFLAG